MKLETRVARFLLECARRAPKDSPGRKVMSEHARIIEDQIISQAQQRKRELAAMGVRKGDAADQAAQEASNAFGKLGRNLSPSTIKRRMQRRQ